MAAAVAAACGSCTRTHASSIATAFATHLHGPPLQPVLDTLRWPFPGRWQPAVRLQGVESGPPSFEDLGVPRGRGWMVLPLGGTHAPGVELEFEIGLDRGAAKVNRRFSWSLCDGDDLLDSCEASVGALRSSEPLRLCVRLPDRAPASYRLILKVTSEARFAESFVWPVEVPEQRVEARLVAQPARVRRGETFTATLHNDGSAEIITGVDFALERLADGRWEDIDPFDGDEDVVWAAVGLLVSPRGSREFQVQVPRMTRPGPHRMIKTVAAETAELSELRVVAEFEVTE